MAVPSKCFLCKMEPLVNFILDGDCQGSLLPSLEQAPALPMTHSFSCLPGGIEKKAPNELLLHRGPDTYRIYLHPSLTAAHISICFGQKMGLVAIAARPGPWGLQSELNHHSPPAATDSKAGKQNAI